MSEKIKLILVAGARPNFMKIAPVIRALQNRAERFDFDLVHTGQHYDEGMSDVFFKDLCIPAPSYHLNVGSGSHANQTAAIMTAFEPILLEHMPNCVVVFGDVNSTLACSIVAKKLNCDVAHVEAGLRSGDMTMPEEVNRIVTDAISDFLFVTEKSGMDNLSNEGKDEGKLFYVGHVMIDNLLFETAKLKEADRSNFVTEKLKSERPRYGVVTLHRPSNVDKEENLSRVIEALGEIGKELPLFFPIHPRTLAALREFCIDLPRGVIACEPLGYAEFLNLWKDASLVLTDSGGLQEETTGLGVPCLTMRDNTERPVTVTEGTNILVGSNQRIIVSEARKILERPSSASAKPIPKFWDGRASDRILDVFEKIYPS